jgi:acetylornithine deacetylase/succinyl-diaminopimelate desuccinylase-like protein
MQLVSVLFLIFLASPLSADESPFSSLPPEQQLSEDILRELVSYESSEDHPTLIYGALQAMEKRLLDAGFLDDDVQLLNPSPDTYGLVVRYRGLGEKRPMLVLAHVDVVQAVPSHWSFPPFVLGKKTVTTLAVEVKTTKQA